MIQKYKRESEVLNYVKNTNFVILNNQGPDNVNLK